MQSFKLEKPSGANDTAREGLTWLVVLIVVGAAVALGMLHFFPGHHSSDHASAVASESGASSCVDSGYTITGRLDGETQTVYTCTIGSRTRCVTEHGGIASDSTDVVQLLFSDALNQAKPACLSS